MKSGLDHLKTEPTEYESVQTGQRGNPYAATSIQEIIENS